MTKSPIDMNYNELDRLLDSLLEAEKLPKSIIYKSDQINYRRRNKLGIMIKAFIRLVQAEIFYMTYIMKRLRPLKKSKNIYNSLIKTGCLKSLRTYLHLAKIGLTDLMRSMEGGFDNKIFTHFAVATMLYDASFDVPVCRKYLKELDAFIMRDIPIKTKDEFTALFIESVEYLKIMLDETTFETFKNYVKIEHISQLMSIYQLSDKTVSKDSLLKITFAKGGIASLVVMRIMVPHMNKKKRNAVFELGAVLQLIDDINDMKEDLEIGIQTLPNQKLLNYNELKQLYFGTVNNVITKCDIDPYKPNGTLDMLCWFAEAILEKRYGRYTTKVP